MKTSSNKKQNNLLGEFGYKILEEINRGENIAIYSLPGMGLNTLIVELVRTYLELSPKNYIVNIYPHESHLINYGEIESLILEKFKYENISRTNKLFSIGSVMAELKANGSKFLIVLHKLNEHKNGNQILEYLKSLQIGYKDNLSILTSLQYMSIIERKENDLFFNYKVFQGFEDNELELLISRIAKQFNAKFTTSGKTIYQLTAGHTGLVKAIVKQGSSNGYKLKELLESEDITKRLREVLQTLKENGVDLSELEKTNSKTLYSYGLKISPGVGELFTKFYSLKYLDDVSLYKELTNTESAILDILKNSPNDYFSVDNILNELSSTKFDTQSNWALYKHINNLKKKLKIKGVGIESKRGKGYKLTKL